MAYYKMKLVKNVKESDVKVLLVGKVVKVEDDGFVLQDESGERKIIFDGEVEEGEIVKAFCSVENHGLRADMVKDLKNFDLNLFKKIRELYNKVGLDV